MKKILLCCFIACGLFITACTNCKEPGPENNAILCGDDLSFDMPIIPGDLQVGQRNRYRLLRGNGYGSASGLDFEYLPDTLIVEVATKNGDVYTLKEFFSCGSQKLTDKPGFVVYADSFATVHVRVANDSFYILPSIGSCCNDSRLFFNHAGALPLQRTIGPIVQIDGWKTTLNYHESNKMALINDAEILDKLWPSLNVASLNAGMQVDGPGFTFLYDREYGIARTAYYSWWTQAGYGFDYME
ncbi:MAG: hypothetical protein J0L99_04485 [Chitinophagales bacterium]|nr:hypothetical protein [Chitinophagales bacterium]